MTSQGEFAIFQGSPTAPISQNRSPRKISDQQVDDIRVAFTSAGKDAMDDRRRFIEGCLMRSVDSIRAITADEARRVLKTLSRPVIKSTGGSAWDDRDEETWIDKL